jgi:hypothetical protein
MNYFISIVLQADGRYLYRLTVGEDFMCSRVLYDISRRGAVKWFKDHKYRLVINRVVRHKTGVPPIICINRVYQFFP